MHMNRHLLHSKRPPPRALAVVEMPWVAREPAVGRTTNSTPPVQERDEVLPRAPPPSSPQTRSGGFQRLARHDRSGSPQGEHEAMTTTEQPLSRRQVARRLQHELAGRSGGSTHDQMVARVAELGHPEPIGELELVLEVGAVNDTKEDFLEQIVILPGRCPSRH
jgi:hypothetical protein